MLAFGLSSAGISRASFTNPLEIRRVNQDGGIDFISGSLQWSPVRPGIVPCASVQFQDSALKGFKILRTQGQVKVPFALYGDQVRGCLLGSSGIITILESNRNKAKKFTYIIDIPPELKPPPIVQATPTPVPTPAPKPVVKIVVPTPTPMPMPTPARVVERKPPPKKERSWRFLVMAGPGYVSHLSKFPAPDPQLSESGMEFHFYADAEWLWPYVWNLSTELEARGDLLGKLSSTASGSVFLNRRIPAGILNWYPGIGFTDSISPGNYSYGVQALSAVGAHLKARFRNEAGFTLSFAPLYRSGVNLGYLANVTGLVPITIKRRKFSLGIEAGLWKARNTGDQAVDYTKMTYSLLVGYAF